jgi:hypothetical protein
MGFVLNQRISSNPSKICLTLIIIMLLFSSNIGLVLYNEGEKMSGQYLRISREEITAAAEYNPREAILMLMGNAALDEAEQQATGVKPYQPRFREMGWSIALETKKGVVGLWFCWLGDRFYLGYPIPTRALPIRVTDKIIMETLGVGYASPVLQVDGTAVNDWSYAGEFKDSDKPLVKNKTGQIVAYRTRGDRLWAKFYGPRINAGTGRVWVDHTEFDSSLHRFEIVDKKSRGGLVSVDYGHEHSRGIYTYPYDFSNEYALDGPTTDKEAILDYRDRFLELFCKIAGIMGLKP